MSFGHYDSEILQTSKSDGEAERNLKDSKDRAEQDEGHLQILQNRPRKQHGNGVTPHQTMQRGIDPSFGHVVR